MSGVSAQDVEPPLVVSPNISRRHGTMGLPYGSHPIFTLRKSLIIIACIGLFLCFISGGPYPGDAQATGMFLLAGSALFSAYDVFLYATKKAEHPDEDPMWPQVKIMTLDVILALVLQLTFWAALGELRWSYGPSPAQVFGAYGILADLICSILHAYCFWKQLMARKQKAWLATLPQEPCARCGYTSTDAAHRAGVQEDRPFASSNTTFPHDPLPNIHPYAGPSAGFRHVNTLTPQSTEASMEEGLLIGSDFGTDYGAIERADTTIEQPQEIMVGKGKKKRTSGSEKSQGKKPVL